TDGKKEATPFQLVTDDSASVPREWWFPEVGGFLLAFKQLLRSAKVNAAMLQIPVKTQVACSRELKCRIDGSASRFLGADFKTSNFPEQQAAPALVFPGSVPLHFSFKKGASAAGCSLVDDSRDSHFPAVIQMPEVVAAEVRLDAVPT